MFWLFSSLKVDNVGYLWYESQECSAAVRVRSLDIGCHFCKSLLLCGYVENGVISETSRTARSVEDFAPTNSFYLQGNCTVGTGDRDRANKLCFPVLFVSQFFEKSRYPVSIGFAIARGVNPRLAVQCIYH